MSACLHEAGHCLLALVEGLPFAKVTRSSLEFSIGDEMPDLTIVHLGGLAAEALAGNVPGNFWETKDMAEAKRCAALALEKRGIEPTKEAVRAELEVQWQGAQVILIRHWRPLHALALTLKRLETISYETAKAIVHEFSSG